MILTVYELLGYAVIFALLRLIWFRLAEGGRDRKMAALVIGAGAAIALVFLSRVDWVALAEDWRDLTANALIVAAVCAVIYGYSRLISAARQRAELRSDEAGREGE